MRIKFRELQKQIKVLIDKYEIVNTARIAETIFNEVNTYIKNPTPWTAMKGLSSIAVKLLNEHNNFISDYFDGDDWERVFSSDFSYLILKVIENYPKKEIAKISGTTNRIVHVDLDGIVLGYVEHVSSSPIFKSSVDIYCMVDQANEAREKISNLLWARLGSSNIVLKCNRSNAWESGYVMYDVDDVHAVKHSDKVDTLTKKFVACKKNNLHRSVLLYGPPGTGKSTLAQSVVSKMGLKSFRLRVEDLHHIDNAAIANAIDIFKPSAIILDDFDRISSQSSILETLEFFQNKVDFVIATVNDKDCLDDAVLRPGRFDEIIKIDTIEESVVKEILQPPVDDKIFHVIKRWPVAFVIEYQKRRSYMSDDEMSETLLELNKRADSSYTLESESAIAEDEVVQNVLKTMKKLQSKKKLSTQRKRRTPTKKRAVELCAADFDDQT